MEMDYSKIVGAVMAEAMEIKRDVDDKKITVNELLNVVKTAVDKLGIGNKVIIDLEKV